MNLHPQVNRNDLELVPFFYFTKNITHVSDGKFIWSTCVSELIKIERGWKKLNCKNNNDSFVGLNV